MSIIEDLSRVQGIVLVVVVGWVFSGVVLHVDVDLWLCMLFRVTV